MPGAMLRHRASKGLRLPGTAGNYATTPDSVLNSISGDLDVRVYCKFASLLPANNQSVIAKRDLSGANPAWSFRLNTGSGTLDFPFWINGAVIIPNSTVGLGAISGVVANQPIWIRATLDVDNGAGQNVTKFYYSFDGQTWIPLGPGSFNNGVAQIDDTIAAILVGGTNSQELNGTVYYAEVRNGIDGPVVVRFDSSQVSTSGSQVPSSINGWTWSGGALYKRDDYVRMPGIVGNNLRYPDTTNVHALSLGDVDLRIKLSVDNVTSTYSLLSKSNLSGQASWRWRYVNNSMEYGYYTDGINIAGTLGSSPLGAVAGVPIWLRITRVMSNGALNFYTSSDGITWVNVGTTTAGTGALFSGNSPLELGARFTSDGTGGTDNLAGNIYYAEARNGINGPTAAFFNGSDNMIQTPWTINGSTWNWEASNFSGKPGIALALPGTPGNGASTPDIPGNSITGDIDIRVKAMLTDWNIGGVTGQTLVAKESSTTTRSYRLDINNPTGQLSLMLSSDGSDGTKIGSTSGALGFAPGSVHWVRATWTQSTHTSNFYSSDDGEAWTLITTTLAPNIASIFDSTSPIEIGARFLGSTNPMAGKIYYAEIRNGIDGPVVSKFDATNIAKQNRGGNLLNANQSGIETDATGWAAVNQLPTLARSTAQFLDGIASLSITATSAAGSLSARTAPTTAIPVTVGVSYISTLWVRGTGSAAQAQAAIYWYTSGGAFISASTSAASVAPSGTWTLYTVTGVAPATAAYGTSVFQTSGTIPTIGDVWFVDRISFTETGLPLTTIQPGGSPNMLTANQANIETDASGWVTRVNSSIGQDATQFLDGTKSLSITSLAAGDMSAETLIGTSGIPVIAGKTYTAVINTKAATVIRQFSTLIQWFNAAGASISTSFSIVPINNSTSVWTSNFISIVAPAGAVFAAAGAFILATGAAAEVHYVDRISLVESSEIWTIGGTGWDWVNTPETTISIGGGSRVLVEV